MNLTRVRDQVVEHLGQPGAVAAQFRQLVRREGQGDAPGGGAGGGRLDGLLGDRLEVDEAHLDRKLPGLDLSEEEQIADQAEQPLGVAIDDPEEPALLVGEVAAFVEQQLEVPADRGEGRPQLVGDERDEVVLEPVELPQPLVLLGQQPLRGLGLGARGPLALQQPAALFRVLAQPAVAGLQLARDPAQDRKQRHVERQQRGDEDQREPRAGVTDADVDRSVVLVELERAERGSRRAQLDRDQRLEHLDVLLAAPRGRSRHAPLEAAGEHVAQRFRVRHLRADQLMPSCVGDPPVAVDETGPDDAGDEDAAAEEYVEGTPAFRRHRGDEVRRPQMTAEVLLRDDARMGLDGPRCTIRHLAIDQPERREACEEQDDAGVDRKAQHDSWPALQIVCLGRIARGIMGRRNHLARHELHRQRPVRG